MYKQYDFKRGDIIAFAGEQYFVESNHGNSGYVREYFNGVVGDELIKFYWSFDGEECKLVS